MLPTHASIIHAYHQPRVKRGSLSKFSAKVGSQQTLCKRIAEAGGSLGSPVSFLCRCPDISIAVNGIIGCGQINTSDAGMLEAGE